MPHLLKVFAKVAIIELFHAMDERSDAEKSDDVLLPGFPFHPTDEELVVFYLKRKVKQKTPLLNTICYKNAKIYNPELLSCAFY